MDTEPRPPPPSFPSAQAIDETFSHSRTCKIVSDSHSQPRQQMASSSAGKGKANHTFSEDEKDVFDDTPDEMYSASADLAAETRRVEEVPSYIPRFTDGLTSLADLETMGSGRASASESCSRIYTVDNCTILARERHTQCKPGTLRSTFARAQWNGTPRLEVS